MTTITPSIAKDKAVKQVTQAVEALRMAMISGNRADLEHIAAESLSYGHSGGKVETKAEFVESITSGKSDFVNIELTNQTISVTGKTAVIRHDLTAETNDGGKPGTVNLHILLVMKKQKGEWKLLARQAVKKVK